MEGIIEELKRQLLAKFDDYLNKRHQEIDGENLVMHTKILVSELENLIEKIQLLSEHRRLAETAIIQVIEDQREIAEIIAKKIGINVQDNSTGEFIPRSNWMLSLDIATNLLDEAEKNHSVPLDDLSKQLNHLIKFKNLALNSQDYFSSSDDSFRLIPDINRFKDLAKRLNLLYSHVPHLVRKVIKHDNHLDYIRQIESALNENQLADSVKRHPLEGISTEEIKNRLYAEKLLSEERENLLSLINASIALEEENQKMEAFRRNFPEAEDIRNEYLLNCKKRELAKVTLARINALTNIINEFNPIHVSVDEFDRRLLIRPVEFERHHAVLSREYARKTQEHTELVDSITKNNTRKPRFFGLGTKSIETERTKLNKQKARLSSDLNRLDSELNEISRKLLDFEKLTSNLIPVELVIKTPSERMTLEDFLDQIRFQLVEHVLTDLDSDKKRIYLTHLELEKALSEAVERYHKAVQTHGSLPWEIC